jgi:hypothetical protein
MMGISWGGFNRLQVAARRPPALKAIGAKIELYLRHISRQRPPTSSGSGGRDE